MDTELLDQIRQIIADVMDVPVDEVSAQTGVDLIEVWDSLRHLNLVLALEQSFDVSFDPEEIPNLTSVEAIVESIQLRRSEPS